jgi:hypothetical protein
MSFKSKLINYIAIQKLGLSLIVGGLCLSSMCYANDYLDVQPTFTNVSTEYAYANGEEQIPLQIEYHTDNKPTADQIQYVYNHMVLTNPSLGIQYSVAKQGSLSDVCTENPFQRINSDIVQNGGTGSAELLMSKNENGDFYLAKTSGKWQGTSNDSSSICFTTTSGPFAQGTYGKPTGLSANLSKYNLNLSSNIPMQAVCTGSNDTDCNVKLTVYLQVNSKTDIGTNANYFSAQSSYASSNIGNGTSKVFLGLTGTNAARSNLSPSFTMSQIAKFAGPSTAYLETITAKVSNQPATILYMMRDDSNHRAIHVDGLPRTYVWDNLLNDPVQGGRPEQNSFSYGTNTNNAYIQNVENRDYAGRDTDSYTYINNVARSTFQHICSEGNGSSPYRALMDVDFASTPSDQPTSDSKVLLCGNVGSIVKNLSQVTTQYYLLDMYGNFFHKTGVTTSAVFAS